MTLSSNDNKTEKSEGSWTKLVRPRSSIPNILTSQTSLKTSKTDPGTAKNDPVKELPVLKPGDEILGKYQVEKVISGGMGHVYIANHKFWHRKFAIKSPNKAMLSKKSLFARILREANAWIDMGLHPNIAYCYYVKKIEQVPHIMVEYVDAGNLRSWIGRQVKNRITDYRQALNFAIQFCHGMEFAHSQGMIHRDIKPENILLTQTGILKITDFGLIRRSDSPITDIQESGQDLETTCTDDSLLTRMGISMGTPPYMSPEQRLNAHDVDGRADIFSFGVCLYEMFCRVRPDLKKCLEPPCPQSLSKDKDFPKILADLIVKCAAHDIDKRYLDFTQLRLDLSRIYQELFNEQSPYASLDILPPAADSLNNKGVSFLELERFKEARLCFEKAVSEDNFHPQANWNIGNFQILNQSLFLSEHQDQTIEMLRAALQESGLSEETAEERIQKALETKDFFQAITVSFPGIESNVNALAFSPCANFIAAGCSDYTISIRAVETGKKLNTFSGHTHSVNSVLFFPKGNILVSAGSDKTIRMWDYKTGREIDVLKGHTGLVSSLALSPCTRFLASGSEDRTIKIWDAKTGKLLKSLESHEYGVNALCFSKDGAQIASAGNDKALILWNAETWEPLIIFEGHEDSINTLAFSSDGLLIASGSRDKTIKLWNLKNGNLQSTIEGHKHWVTALEFSHDNRFLISAGSDQTIRVWDGKTGHIVKTIEGHKHEVSCLAFSPDGQYLASGSRDNKINLWNTNVLNSQLTLPQDYVYFKNRFTEKQQKLKLIKKLISRKQYFEAYKKILDSWKQEGFGRESSFYGLFSKIQSKGSVSGIKNITPFIRIKAHTDNISSLCFSQDGKKLVSASNDNTAKVWSVNDGKLLMTTDSISGPVSSAGFSIDGRFIAAGSKEVKLWDIETGESVNTFKGHSKVINALAFSPDGNFLATGSRDQSVRIWDLKNNSKAIHILKDHGQEIDSIAFSKDSRLIAAGGGLVLRLWETETGSLVRELKGHKLFMTPVAFSPDGNFLASVSSDNSIYLWDLSNFKAEDLTAQNISRHTGDISTLDFSPDSRFIISGSADHSIKIWDVKKKTLLKTLEGHTAHVGSAAFCPDGRFIGSGSRDNTIRLWLIIPELTFDQDMFLPSFSEKQNLAHLENLISQNKDMLAFQKLIEIWELEQEEEKRKLFPVFEKLKSKGTKTGIRGLVPIKTFKGHTSYVESVCFSPDSKFIASGSWDKTIRVWDMDTADLLTTLKWHVSHVKSVGFSPDGSLLASGSGDSSIVIWNVAEMKLLKILEDHRGRVHSLSFLQNNEILVSGGEDNCIKFWEISTGKIIKNVQGQKLKVNTVAFSPKDRFIAIGDDTGNTRLISLKGRKINRIIKADKVSVNALAFSPDESMLASGRSDKKVIIWDVKNSRLLHSLQNHTQEVRTVAFSPDNELMASGGDDHRINLWDIKTGILIQALDGQMKSVRSLAFSPDGKFIASGSEDNTVRLWLIIPDLKF